MNYFSTTATISRLIIIINIVFCYNEAKFTKSRSTNGNVGNWNQYYSYGLAGAFRDSNHAIALARQEHGSPAINHQESPAIEESHNANTHGASVSPNSMQVMHMVESEGAAAAGAPSVTPEHHEEHGHSEASVAAGHHPEGEHHHEHPLSSANDLGEATESVAKRGKAILIIIKLLLLGLLLIPFTILLISYPIGIYAIISFTNPSIQAYIDQVNAGAAAVRANVDGIIAGVGDEDELAFSRSLGQTFGESWSFQNIFHFWIKALLFSSQMRRDVQEKGED